MMNLIIFGAPGAGKGTQAEILAQKYNLNHISTGELLRKQIEKQSELGEKVKNYLDAGELVPDNLILEIIKTTIETSTNQGFIFDGFPRTINQAEAFDKLLEEQKQLINAVLILEVPKEELIDRLQKRAEKSNRSDDSSLETINNRLNVYKEKTEALIDYYQKQNKAIFVNGLGTIEEIAQRLKTEIDKL